jgi:outer membrane receptor protein involved in Fe transport
VNKWIAWAGVALAFGLATDRAVAADAAETTDAEPQKMEEVIIFARGEELIGKADAASEGAVGGADLSVRPLLRVAELLEVVPGLIAAQHSGSGKANQYFLRGFNLDHGTDFTTYIDDVPMNFRTHGHGQGYLDLNGLIPETVDRIDYRKGTYRADVGDFSMAGSSFMTTVKDVQPFAAAEVGQYGWKRLAAGGSAKLGEGEFTFVGQVKGYDGPWQLPEDLKHESGWAKYSLPTGIGNLELSLSGYHATWHPTEQIPERAIGTSVCANEFCALDPTAIGETLRYIGTARLLGDDWRATLYGQYYDWHMLSNPTYDFQINQFDRRSIVGGRYEHGFKFGDRLSLSAGAEFRYDDIGNVGVEHTDQGQFVSPVSRHAVKEGSISPYTEMTWTPIDKLRIIGGLRYDYYNFDVRALESGLDEGQKSDSTVSPKIGFAYTLNSIVEFYGNWGRGFHSNDARGVVNNATPVEGLSQGTGKEFGARFEFGDFRFTTTYWWLDLNSELEFVGDTNSVEPGPATARRGYELVGFWRPITWMAFDAVWTGSHARHIDSPGAEFVEGAVENAGELGVSAIKDKWEVGARLRYLGDYPLTEDNTERADAEVMVNVRAAWKGQHITVYGELLNLLDSHGKDIVYWYAAHVPGIDPPGFEEEGRISRAEEPRTLRVGVKYQF